MRKLTLTCLLLLALVSLAADAPYFGKWKVDSSKSDLTSVLTLEKLPSGDYHYDNVGFAYTFKPDGKEYPAPDGSTIAWKATSENVWDVTVKANGKVSASLKFTRNGDTLSVAQTIMQSDGKNIAQTSSWKRISGGPGFVGKWKGTQADSGASWLELTPDGTDGIKMAGPGSLCVAKFDGKPYPMSGSGDGSKQTMSFHKKGTASFEATTYLDGKLFFKDVYTVSADGKALTDVGTPAATKKPLKVVLERQ
jgi:hypothetical protein